MVIFFFFFITLFVYSCFLPRRSVLLRRIDTKKLHPIYYVKTATVNTVNRNIIRSNLFRPKGKFIAVVVSVRPLRLRSSRKYYYFFFFLFISYFIIDVPYMVIIACRLYGPENHCDLNRQ